MLTKRIPLILSFVILAMMISGAIYSYFLGDLFRFTDEKEYYTIAENLLQKGFLTINGSDPSAWRPPAYPIWLSLWMFFGSNIFMLRLINFACLASSALLVYKILQKYPAAIQLLGALLLLIQPLFFFTASTLYPQIFTMFLFLLTLYLLSKQSPLSYKKVLIIGILYGILTLSVVTFIGSFAVTAIWVVYKEKNGWKKGFVMSLGLLMVLAPWTLRNALIFHHFIPFSTNGGIAFVLGNSKDTKPNAGGTISLPTFDPEKVRGEVEINSFYQKKAIEYIFDHKWDSLKMYALKFLNYFNYDNQLMTKSEMSSFRHIVLFFSYYALIVLVLLRLMRQKQLPLSKDELYYIVLYVAHGLLLALFITRIRYRLPYDPLLILLAAPIFQKSK